MAFQSVASQIIRLDKKVRQATIDALYIAGQDMVTQNKDVTRDWKHKVDFAAALTVGIGYYEVFVKPTGRNVKIYKYVDRGTKGPYPIPKIIVPGKFLRFRLGYSARTAPVAKFNIGTGVATGAWVTKQQIQHPGIKARKFMETFLDELAPPLVQRVQSEITKAVR